MYHLAPSEHGKWPRYNARSRFRRLPRSPARSSASSRSRSAGEGGSVGRCAARWAAAGGYAVSIPDVGERKARGKKVKMEELYEKHLQLDAKDCKEHYDANRFPDVQWVTKPKLK